MSPGRFTQRGLNASGSCSGEQWGRIRRGKLLLRYGVLGSAIEAG